MLAKLCYELDMKGHFTLRREQNRQTASSGSKIQIHTQLHPCFNGSASHVEVASRKGSEETRKLAAEAKWSRREEMRQLAQRLQVRGLVGRREEGRKAGRKAGRQGGRKGVAINALRGY